MSMLIKNDHYSNFYQVFLEFCHTPYFVNKYFFTNLNHWVSSNSMDVFSFHIKNNRIYINPWIQSIELITIFLENRMANTITMEQNFTKTLNMIIRFSY